LNPDLVAEIKYWGIKNYQNEVSADPSSPIFGRLSRDCTDDREAPAIPEYGGGTTRSYARLHTETANSSNHLWLGRQHFRD
jgi:hypothetical protein